MIAFRIVVNGKRIVTAGLPGHHVLSAILSSVWRDPAQKAKWRSKQRFLERELGLSMTGLDIDLERHFGWFNRAVKVGDRIEIEVLDTDDADSPVHRSRKSLTAKKATSGSRARKAESTARQRPRKRAAGSGKRKSKAGSAQRGARVRSQ